MNYRLECLKLAAQRGDDEAERAIAYAGFVQGCGKMAELGIECLKVASYGGARETKTIVDLARGYFIFASTSEPTEGG